MKRGQDETLYAILDEQGRVTMTVWNRAGTKLPPGRAVECDDHISVDYDHDGNEFKLARNDHLPADSEPDALRRERIKLDAQTFSEDTRELARPADVPSPRQP